MGKGRNNGTKGGKRQGVSKSLGGLSLTREELDEAVVVMAGALRGVKGATAVRRATLALVGLMLVCEYGPETEKAPFEEVLGEATKCLCLYTTAGDGEAAPALTKDGGSS